MARLQWSSSLDRWRAALVRFIHHPCSRRSCRIGYRWLDSEHRGSDPDADSGNLAVHLHVRADVRLAFLRQFHREKSRTFAGWHFAGLRQLGLRWLEPREWNNGFWRRAERLGG